jgi:CheY-like chemotaxis protein
VITQDQTPVRVLVVDDSEVFRHVVCDLVAATPGFEVIADAASGREALALVGSMAAQLVMLDVHMPELDGIETASRIRRQFPDVVVLLLTASKREQLSDPSLTIEDKRNLSCRLLADFWRRHCPDG